MTDFPVYSPAGLEPDAGAIQQQKVCMEAGNAVAGVLCADHHLGYSAAIGSAIAYDEYISPSGVGYDIGCGNKGVATNLFYADVRNDLPRIMDEIIRRVSFGMGRDNLKPIDDPFLDEIAHCENRNIKALTGLAKRQLGTVGAGNHYVDLFREEGTDRIWVGVHFGSRGFGHKTASGFLALAQGKAFDDHPSGGEMHSPPVLFHVDSALGYLYLEAMGLAGNYAYAGRNAVCREVLDILGAESYREVHNHHNFAWQEETLGGKAWVIRKGSTPLWPGQEGFVGASMAEPAYIVRGAELLKRQPENPSEGDKALWSAPHGAGRIMSRTEAKGKVNRKTGEVIRAGKVDWVAAKADLKAKGIELRGGAADEAPAAYKRLPAVLEAHSGYIEITTKLNPIGVAMAGPNVKDLYKD